MERYPTNDYAHFCLGRALDLTGRSEAANRHLAIAANLRPDRNDYRVHVGARRLRPPQRGVRALVQRVSSPRSPSTTS